MADYDTKTIPILDDIIEDVSAKNAELADDSSVSADDLPAAAESNLDLFADGRVPVISEQYEPPIGVIDSRYESQADQYLDHEDLDHEDLNHKDLVDTDQDAASLPIESAAAELTALDTEVSYATEIEIDSNEDDSEDSGSSLIDYHSATGDGSDFTADIYTDADLTATDEVPVQDTGSDPAAYTDPFAEIESSVQSIKASMEAEIETVEPAALDATADTPALESIVDDIVKQLLPDLEQQLRFLVQQALEDRLSDEALQQITADNIKH